MAVKDESARVEVGLRGFGGVWLASGASNFADGLLIVSFPVLALTLTASPGLVAAVAAVAGLPWLLAPLAGVLADRVNRRILAASVNMGRAAILLVLGLLIISDSLSFVGLLTLALLLGAMETLVDSASETLVPTLVRGPALEAANTRLRVTSTVTNLFLGPGLAGLLFLRSAAVPFLLAAGLYIVATIFIAGLHGDFKPDREDSKASVRSDIAEGARWLRSQPLLLRLAVMLSVIVAAQSMVTAVLVIYAVTPGPMGLNEFGFGLLRFAIAGGGIFAGLLVARLILRIGRANLLKCCVAGGVIMFAIPAVTDSVTLVALGLFVGGMAEMIWVVIVRSLAQLLTPNQMLGRVGSIYTLIAWGSIPFGSALGGLLGELIGVRGVFAVAATVTIVLGVVFMRRITSEIIEAARSAVSGNK